MKHLRMLVLAKSFHRSRKPQFPQLADYLYKLRVVVRVCESVFVSLFGVGGGWAQWKNTGGLKQKHKKQPFSDASASHLSLVLWHV